MNSLSIAFYAVDFLSTAEGFARAALFACLTGQATYSLVAAMVNSDNLSEYNKKYHPEKYNRALEFFKKRKWLPSRIIVIAILVSAAVIAAVPSKQTMYLMLGSEVAEAAINTPQAQELYYDIRAAIRGLAQESVQE